MESFAIIKSTEVGNESPEMFSCSVHYKTLCIYLMFILLYLAVNFLFSVCFYLANDFLIHFASWHYFLKGIEQ